MVCDDFAAKLSAEYALFLLALSGRYQQMRAPGVEVTPRAIANMDKDARQLAGTFYGTAECGFDDYLRTLLADASDALQSALTVRKKEALALVRGMLFENAQTAMKMTRTGIGGTVSLLGGAHGAIGLLVQQQAGKIDYRVTDTAGRKWKAEALFRVVTRDFAYQSGIDSQVERLTLAGVNLVETPKGRVLSLRGTDSYESLADVRESVFHINSHEYPVPHAASP
ncbi:MAG: hypothetical protein FWF12_00460 [Betaproteobacteria bacterium]|nr:hypothetical protein [Betaproteobacteria bacterium]